MPNQAKSFIFSYTAGKESEHFHVSSLKEQSLQIVLDF